MKTYWTIKQAAEALTGERITRQGIYRLLAEGRIEPQATDAQGRALFSEAGLVKITQAMTVRREQVKAPRGEGPPSESGRLARTGAHHRFRLQNIPPSRDLQTIHLKISQT